MIRTLAERNLIKARRNLLKATCQHHTPDHGNYRKNRPLDGSGRKARRDRANGVKGTTLKQHLAEVEHAEREREGAEFDQMLEVYYRNLEREVDRYDDCDCELCSPRTAARVQKEYEMDWDWDTYDQFLSVEAHNRYRDGSRYAA